MDGPPVAECVYPREPAPSLNSSRFRASWRRALVPFGAVAFAFLPLPLAALLLPPPPLKLAWPEEAWLTLLLLPPSGVREE